MVKLISGLIRLLGNSNVSVDNTTSPLLVSRIDKKNENIRFVFIMATLMCVVMFVLSLIALVFFRDLERGLFILFLGIVLGIAILIIATRMRMMQGDTILIKKNGIEEINWLISHLILWNEIQDIHFNELGPISFKYGRKIFPTSNYPAVTIKGKQHKITIKEAQPELSQIKALIRNNYHGTVSEQIIEPIYGRIIFSIIAISSLFSYVFFSKYVNEVVKSIWQSIVG